METKQDAVEIGGIAYTGLSEEALEELMAIERQRKLREYAARAAWLIR